MDDAEIYRLLGRNVAAHRTNRKLTQAQVAERIGLTRASLANIETGRQRAMLHHVYELVDALKLDSITDLLPSRRPGSWAESANASNGDDQGREIIRFSDNSLTAVEKAQVENVITKALMTKNDRRR
jgi:transcriptional regulator with XRE-family HTH domain